MYDDDLIAQLPELLYRGPGEAPRFAPVGVPVRGGRDPFAGYFRVYRWERRIVVRGTPERGAWEEYKCFPRTVYCDGLPVAIVWCRLEQLPAARDLDELGSLLGVTAPLTISSDIDVTAIRRFALHP
jgi:hypothetical protein